MTEAMAKRTYIHPGSNVIRLQHRHQLLNASSVETTNQRQLKLRQKRR
jgi:hypothetical protein